MLSLEEVKKLLNDPKLTDEEVLEIRDQLYSLAEIIFEKYQEDRKKEREKNSKKIDSSEIKNIQ